MKLPPTLHMPVGPAPRKPEPLDFSDLRDLLLAVVVGAAGGLVIVAGFALGAQL